LAQMQSSLRRGAMPARALADAMMIGLAAVLLVLPGFLSDIVALSLLLQPVRSWIYASLSRGVVVRTAGTGYRPSAEPPRVSRPDTIDLDHDDYRQG